ncbi:hypothetical protein [Endozoicomonas ascidiicola]|uniref:hypothetical protein n=1 Tax=Endozoicomonas ascidiicola TaxID=1698521 RepID=UPI00082E6DC0|nr:hypothetical protein [Endozoicomonas ascidiicola]
MKHFRCPCGQDIPANALKVYARTHVSTHFTQSTARFSDFKVQTESVLTKLKLKENGFTPEEAKTQKSNLKTLFGLCIEIYTAPDHDERNHYFELKDTLNKRYVDIMDTIELALRP